MSVQAIASALALQGVTPSEKLLLIVLANYADEKMVCWPSHSRLSSDTCMSERNILRLFKSLEARGLVQRKARMTKIGRRSSDLIRLFLVGTPRPQHGDTTSPIVGTPCPISGDTVSDEPSKNRQLEPSARGALFSEHDQEDRKKVGAMMKALALQMKGGRA